MSCRSLGKMESWVVVRNEGIPEVAKMNPTGATTWESDLCLRNLVALVSELRVHIALPFLADLGKMVSDNQKALGLRNYGRQNLDTVHAHWKRRVDLDAVAEVSEQLRHQVPSCDSP